MIFTYRAEELRDPYSGWWAAAYAEHAAKTAVFMLFEAFDNFWLWCLSAELIRGIRELDLEAVLGFRANARELERFLTVIERQNWQQVLDHWSASGEAGGLSPERCGAGGNYLYYNPYTERKLGQQEG